MTKILQKLDYLKGKHGWSDVGLETNSCCTISSWNMCSPWLNLHCILTSSIALWRIVSILLVVAIVKIIHLKRNTNYTISIRLLKDKSDIIQISIRYPRSRETIQDTTTVNDEIGKGAKINK